jgi:cytoskeletal protein CcmA (bactofilin family)
VPEEVRVPRGTHKHIDEVDGDLIVNDATVSAETPGGVIKVHGVTECRDDCRFESSLETTELRGSSGDILVQGDLTATRLVKLKRGRLEVDGNLVTPKIDVDKSVDVSGDLDTGLARVGGSITVEGNAKATRVDVGGSFKVFSQAEIEEIDVGGSVTIERAAKTGLINVGGSFKGNGPVEADKIDVGGSVRIEGEADVNEIDVGGTVKLEGGKVGNIKVGGSLKASRPLNFGNIRVGGSVKISGGVGREIDVGGTFKSDGDLEFVNIDVGGTVKIDGDAKGRNIDVGGTVSVNGDLDLSEDLRVGGKASIDGILKARTVRVGGKVEAFKIEAIDEIATNTLRTRKGAKAEEIGIGRRGEAEGPLIANKILIRERARVEDVYGGTVVLRRGSRANNVYAERLTIENDCRITGEVKYTDTLRADRDARLSMDPEKTEKLPAPPF